MTVLDVAGDLVLCVRGGSNGYRQADSLDSVLMAFITIEKAA
jgi:hypothetical protein